MIRGTEQLRIAAKQAVTQHLQQIDAEISGLLNATRMPGEALELDYQAQPSFLQSLACHGYSHDLVLIRPPEFEGLAGMGIRSLRYCYLQGKPSKVGYLHHLRLHPKIRGGPYLARGYRAVRSFFNAQPAPVTLTSILAGNARAQSLLENQKASRHMPVYKRVARYLTALIPLKGPGKRWPSRFRQKNLCLNEFFNDLASAKASDQNGRAPTQIRMLEEKDLHKLCTLFAEAGKTTDGLPVISSQSFAANDFPGLQITDFVGIFNNDKLVAACGLWNQRACKQIVVRKLGPALRSLKKLWQLTQKLFGPCPIPDEGRQVDQILLDPWTILPGHIDKTAALLLKAACAAAKKRGHDFAAWGIPANHPAFAAAKSVFFIPYWSIIYQVYWPEHGYYEFSGQNSQLMNLGAL